MGTPCLWCRCEAAPARGLASSLMRPPAEQASVEVEVMAEGWRPMLEELQVEDEAELAAVVQLMMPCGDGAAAAGGGWCLTKASAAA